MHHHMRTREPQVLRGTMHRSRAPPPRKAMQSLRVTVGFCWTAVPVGEQEPNTHTLGLQSTDEGGEEEEEAATASESPQQAPSQGG